MSLLISNGAVLVVVKRQDPQKALKWPTKSVATLFLLCSIPVFPLFSGSCSFFSLQTIFTDQLLYLFTYFPPLFLSSNFHCNFSFLFCHQWRKCAMTKIKNSKEEEENEGKKRRMLKNLAKGK